MLRPAGRRLMLPFALDLRTYQTRAERAFRENDDQYS
jgi:hypothetical protein